MLKPILSLALALLLLSAPGFAQQPLGRTHAILIGVDDYYRTTSLNYPGQDVRLLNETLKTHCGCQSVYVMTQDSPLRDQPDFAKVLGALRDEMQVANGGGFDSLLIFFAGHGLKKENGELFLAPDDFIPGLVDQTCIPISRIRELLAGCDQITHKFLILDTCHSGANNANKAEFDAQPTGRDIAKQLGSTPGLITFASCRADESSIEWPQCGHGLFSFWVCVGLSGWADQGNQKEPRDGRIEVQELHEFVSRMVKASLDLFAERKGIAHSQHPDLVSPAHAHKVVIASVNQEKQKANINALLNRASRLIDLQRPEDAITELDKAMDLKPWDPTICAWKAKAYQHLYDHKEKKSEHLTTALANLDTAVLLTEYRMRYENRNELSSDLDTIKQRRQALLDFRPEIAR